MKAETMLLLGNGHCFRDHVLQVCPEFARFSSDAEGIQRTFEGSSLETIKHMVASGMGVTLVPRLSVSSALLHAQASAVASDAPSPAWSDVHYVRYLPFEDDAPTRRVVLAWRRSFTRLEAVEALKRAIASCELPGVRRLMGAVPAGNGLSYAR